MREEKTFFIGVILEVASRAVCQTVIQKVSSNCKEFATALQFPVNDINFQKLENTVVYHLDAIIRFFFGVSEVFDVLIVKVHKVPE